MVDPAVYRASTVPWTCLVAISDLRSDFRAGNDFCVWYECSRPLVQLSGESKPIGQHRHYVTVGYHTSINRWLCNPACRDRPQERADGGKSRRQTSVLAF